MPNELIHNLWLETDPAERGEFVPKFYGDINPCDVLSVGLNPSMPANRPGFLDDFPEMGDYPACFNWGGSPLEDDFHIVTATRFSQIDQAAIDGYPTFFRRPLIVANALGQNVFAHADLFFIRTANLTPNYFRAQNHRHNAVEMNFIQRQLNLSLLIITAYQPRFILFVYAKAADIFLRYYTSLGMLENEVTFNHIPGTRVRACPINLLGNGQQTFLIRWPGLPNSRRRMPTNEFQEALPRVLQHVQHA